MKCFKNRHILHFFVFALAFSTNSMAIAQKRYETPHRYIDPSNPTHADVQIRDFLYWAQIGFSTSFPNAHSENYTTPNLPDGWVVCQHLVGSSAVGTGAGWSYGFINALPNDDQSPPRKKAIIYYLTAPASHDPTNQWGSNVYLFNVGIRAISDYATVKERWDHGCEMDH